MSGWASLAAIGLAAFALLVALRVARPVWTLVAAFLMLGAAGYARQQHADLPGSPVAADALKLPVQPDYRDMRDALYGRFNAEAAYFAISDSQLAAGDATFAGQVIEGGLKALPKDIALWSEYGNIIALHDEGAVSPAALAAFDRAMTLAPQHPGPPYFLGYAYVRAGEFAKARLAWARALALTPMNASYRGEIAEELAALDQMLAQPQPQAPAQ